MIDITCVSLYGCLSLTCFSKIPSTPIHPCISDVRTIDMWRREILLTTITTEIDSIWIDVLEEEQYK